MKLKRLLILTGGVLLIAWLVPPIVHRLRGLCPVRPGAVGAASALPSFSRKYGYSCSQCHTAYPILNDFGRRFKLNGFALEGEGVLESSDKELWTEKLFPWGLILRSRPFDNGRGSVANTGGWSGSSTGSGGTPNSNGFKMQALNDVDFFVAGGDASKHVSWMGEIDANAGGGFTPGSGDLQLGFHPSSYLNFILARKNFFVLEPYQTLSSMESPTIQPRATDGMLPDQTGLSGNSMTEQTQTAAVLGTAGPLFYMAGITTSANDNLGKSSKNGNARLAFDTGKGLVVGTFGSFGHESPAAIPASGGTPNGSIVAAALLEPVYQVEYMKTGIDALVEAGNWVGRGAFLYGHENATKYDRINDPLGINSFNPMTDKAAYAELMYVFKQQGSDTPFLVPLVRENWYTTYNSKRSFNYWTFQLAHFFKSNVKAFVEYTVDTKTDKQGVPVSFTSIGYAGNPADSSSRVGKGNRISAQIEVGF